MNLKILFIPSVIVIVLVLIILYIKPDFSTMQIKKQELAVKNEQVAKMDAVIGNIGTLGRELDGKQESEEFLYRYLPQTLDHDRIVDAFNFLGEQTGVALASLSLEEPRGEESAESLVAPGEGAFTSLNPTLNAAGPGGLPPSVPLVTPKKVVLKMAVEGTYGNIREFLTRVSHMDRFHEFSVIQLEEKMLGSEGQANNNSNPLLTANLEIRLDFLSKRKVDSALNVPLFQQSTFDFVALEARERWVTNPLPPLEKVEGGKTNPFQE